MGTQSKKKVVLVLAAILVAAAAFVVWNALRPSEGAGEISVTSCGAVGNDDKDDYEAFAACLAKATAQNKPLYVPAGEYLLSDIVTLDGIKLIGEGVEQTTLVSTNPERGSIDLTGTGVGISHLTHRYQQTVPRGNGADDKNSITVRDAENFDISGIKIDGSSTAGILVRGASAGGTITNNIIEQTGADGIHITDGSTDITIENNTVKQAGDDTIAVVSYLADAEPVRQVTIQNNDVGHDSEARGISVVGGEDIRIENNSITRTMMAGIYIAVERQWETRDTHRIEVLGNTVDHTGMRENSDHPNILVYASQGTLNDVSITDNMISNSVHSGVGVWGDGDIGNVYFTSNKVSTPGGDPAVFKNGEIHLNKNSGF